MTNEIKIYVADLAAYNSGHLHGVWIDATLEPKAMHEQIAAMLAASPVGDAEEYAIHDYEGFGEYSVGEYADIETIHDIAEFITANPDFGTALLGHFGDFHDARQAADGGYRGCYASVADYAQELTEETTQIPESIRLYIDYDAMARDMEINGDVFSIETGLGEVHVFQSH